VAGPGRTRVRWAWAGAGAAGRFSPMVVERPDRRDRL